MSNVAISYQLTRAEWVSARRSLDLRLPIFWFMVIPGLATCGFLLALASIRDDAWSLLPGLSALAVWLYVILRSSSRVWANSRALQDPRRIELDDDHVHMVTTAFESTSKWSRFRRAYEFDDAYVMTWGMGFGNVVIPKRAISSPDEEQALRLLVAKHVDAHFR